MYKITIDVGGTFTDAVVLDEARAVRHFKSPTTYPDPSIGFMAALELAAEACGRELPGLVGATDVLIHGTTLATNALIDRSGAKVGMLTTRNFRDVLEIRRGHKNVHTSMYDMFVPPYKPLVPRARRLEVAERVTHTGEVLEPLDERGVRDAAVQLRENGVEAVAVCFLHSYANPEHERRAAAIARELLGEDCYVITSADILPMWREWERFSTTALSAYLGPVVERYLTRLSRRLADAGFGGSLLMMLSDGLVGTLDHCTEHAVQMLRSGPAAAPAAALDAGATIGARDLLSIDMGGTSLDVCVIAGAEVPMTRESWVEDERVATKMVDVHSVGAGGGSVAWLDSLGLLRVGPRSAGSTPGPACYGRGGSEPTVTDADLLLGYLPTDAPLGGQIALQADRARAAVATVASSLGMDVDEAAQAIFTTVNSFMADQITEVSTRRGHDVRDFTLVAGGGMGPLHGPLIAKLLGIEAVLVPASAGTYSAFGMLAMDVGRTYIRTHVARISELDLGAVQRAYDEMEAEARAAFGGTEVVLARTADVRYVGQFSEVEIEIPGGELAAADLELAGERFHARHRELFTFNMPWKEIELLTLSLRATAPRRVARATVARAGGGEAIKGMRACWFEGDRVQADVYGGAELATGAVFDGPAIVEEAGTTMVVPPGFTCTADRAGGYVLRNGSAGSRLATAGAEREERP